ncbi:MAG: AMP-binding protein [Polyangia bacterium]
MTIFYTAPTAIRAFMRWGDAHPRSHRLDTLRLLGTVGEPINPAAWVWYHETIGRGRCPIVDTWWQTETGGVMVAPLPGATVAKPGSCTQPLPGIAVEVVHKDGSRCGKNEGGYCGIDALVAPDSFVPSTATPNAIEKPILATSKVDGRPVYFTGDGARFDEETVICG